MIGNRPATVQVISINSTAQAPAWQRFAYICRIVMLVILTLGLVVQPGISSAQNLNLKDLLKKNQIEIKPGVVDPNVGGDLVLDPNQVVCFAPFIKKNNKCVCPQGKFKLGNKCLPLLVACILPFTPDGNGNCVCPPGKKKVGNTCKLNILVPIQIQCNAPFVPNKKGKKCVCPADTFRVGNNCIGINAIPCAPPFVKNNQGICGCPLGTKKVGNSCQAVQVEILCQAPFVPNNAGKKCVCPHGTKKLGNTCVSKQPTPQAPQCNWPFVYKSSTNTCECARGYRLSNSGNSCLKKVSTPSVSRTIIREIQFCLGRLDYDAGPADGAIGRRTRNAWSNFRRDEGLQARPGSLADAVTQDRLFQACANLDQSPAPAPQPVPVPVPEPDDSEPADSSGTNFDPETGYPGIQCASKAVAILLQGLVGPEPEIGICGEVCVPIPEGMTPQQIDATSASINWCKNCTQVGENGLLCSGNPDEGSEEGDDAAN